MAMEVSRVAMGVDPKPTISRITDRETKVSNLRDESPEGLGLYTRTHPPTRGVGRSMTYHEFEPSFHTIHKIDALPLGRVLREEQSMYQADMEFAYAMGGPITREFVSNLPFGPDDNVLIDIRVHQLRKGYYPAIPGYHLDWLPRTNKGADPVVDAIPDYDHVVLIVAETSLTEFINQPVVLSLPSTGAFEYANYELKRIGVDTEYVVSGDMVQFTSRDWHRPSPAQGEEWRLLIRASRVAHKKPTNKMVTQSQVYIPIEEAKW